MRFIILLTLSIIGFTASAQFWHRKPKPQEDRFTQLTAVSRNSVTVKPVINIPYQDIHDLQLPRGAYNLELAEDVIMAEAKHNMRFRQYNLASYNFSDLAALYMLQNRFSEAKWYLLQSNAIARQQDDTKHTLSNLLALADIKFQIGEPTLAKLDMQEAHDIAAAKGMQADLIEIDKKIQYLQNSKLVAVKAEIHYDSAVEAANSKKIIN
ncbi:hypothetical protein [Mucilaginibacter sp.]|uniref:hypothetical protein n=1 Tax=Mucilaginibacter sp. TaxID=1882438 RepID=UPI0026053C2E|nr:hypothetical protein [Mucilaginibacter sp.]MDB5031836.1 hypothetical protein [Mucilaginibacter sp.]